MSYETPTAWTDVNANGDAVQWLDPLGVPQTANLPFQPYRRMLARALYERINLGYLGDGGTYWGVGYFDQPLYRLDNADNYPYVKVRVSPNGSGGSYITTTWEAAFDIYLLGILPRYADWSDSGGDWDAAVYEVGCPSMTQARLLACIGESVWLDPHEVPLAAWMAQRYKALNALGWTIRRNNLNFLNGTDPRTGRSPYKRKGVWPSFPAGTSWADAKAAMPALWNVATWETFIPYNNVTDFGLYASAQGTPTSAATLWAHRVTIDHYIHLNWLNLSPLIGTRDITAGVDTYASLQGVYGTANYNAAELEPPARPLWSLLKLYQNIEVQMSYGGTFPNWCNPANDVYKVDTLPVEAIDHAIALEIAGAQFSYSGYRTILNSQYSYRVVFRLNRPGGFEFHDNSIAGFPSYYGTL